MLLQNELLRLRALEPTDLELLYDWENNPEIWNISNTLAPYSKFVLHQYIENSHRDLYESKQLRLIIEVISEKKYTPVGTIDLYDIDFYHKRAGIGILVANLNYRKKGYAKATVKILEEYGTTHLGLSQFYCQIDEDNESSLALFQQLGYEITGKQKNWKKKQNGWNNVYFLQHLF